MLGSETLAKDCLEYVVFEKHLSEEYGEWRIHGKIIPSWMPPRLTPMRTSKQPDFSGEEYKEEKKKEVEKKEEEVTEKAVVEA